MTKRERELAQKTVLKILSVVDSREGIHQRRLVEFAVRALIEFVLELEAHRDVRTDANGVAGVEFRFFVADTLPIYEGAVGASEIPNEEPTAPRLELSVLA